MAKEKVLNLYKYSEFRITKILVNHKKWQHDDFSFNIRKCHAIFFRNEQCTYIFFVPNQHSYKLFIHDISNFQ